MPVNPSTSTSGASSVYNSSPFSTNAKMMSPEQIIALCARVLNNLGSQLEAYKDQVMARNDRQNEIRAIQSQLKELTPNGSNLQNCDPNKYNELMTRLAKLLPDEQAQKAYDALVHSYGTFTSTEDLPGLTPPMKKGEQVGVGAGGEQDKHLTAKEVDEVSSYLSKSLESLNSDNEVTSMNLQQIMQYRNQASQLYASIQSSMNETMKAVIGKIG